MDFIIKLPTILRQNDSIMLAVDKLSKETHFILVNSTHKTYDITNIFMKEIFKFHGLPKAIISDKDTKFTSNFWKCLFKDFSTQLNFSTTFHSQTNGQTKKVSQVLDGMLRMYVKDKSSI